MVNVKEYPLYFFSYSMEIKEQTRKLAAGCSKHCFEVVDIELTKSVTIYTVM
ncbi:hypothetical protein [Streptococcus pneumoniae]|uniref:hypothetical protein n=1 Tax=Streptococcus pneumoniae TaxID=1313 RepID=UPI0012947933|nr:hypothetical protein [Streptococcus pneumoniae]